jgi:hypothetical protein
VEKFLLSVQDMLQSAIIKQWAKTRAGVSSEGLLAARLEGAVESQLASVGAGAVPASELDPASAAGAAKLDSGVQRGEAAAHAVAAALSVEGMGQEMR